MLSAALMACANMNTQPKLEDECLYSPEQTQFAFWSNVAEQMEVRIYNDANGEASLNDANDVQTVSLKKGSHDFWTATVKGDLEGKFYTVRSFQNGEWAPESPDIFAKAVSGCENGRKIRDLGFNPCFGECFLCIFLRKAFGFFGCRIFTAAAVRSNLAMLIYIAAAAVLHCISAAAGHQKCRAQRQGKHFFYTFVFHKTPP